MAETPKPFSVSSLTAAMKSLLETKFLKIYVEGEISGFKRYPSGHVYFTLKDESAQISAVMFSSYFERCRVKAALKDGAKVLLYATVSLYQARGSAQLNVFAAKLVGEGDLMQRYLELKAKLEAEGLFDPRRKRPLPFMPRRIGIVSSEAGAVIHDMINVFKRRFPALEIRLFPALVQGEGAAESIIAGIEYFQRNFSPELLIVARGGGSFEDLFCFNDERLVRAIALSKIPTISAVGHETDFTLCDFAADKRAGTPSIAAEIAVPQLNDLKARIENSLHRLSAALRAKGENYAIKIDRLTDRLEYALVRYVERGEARLNTARRSLELLSPYSVLERGYSLTLKSDGAVVKSEEDVRDGETISVRLSSGEIKAVVRKNY
ncbi:MAG: exodeoxyribonuclease VII large subunit [Kiritimatiellae bacterium]|nr:exodeoxyribonuclease VII large subunit [Kiritimatiellia bacterium]